MEKLAYLGGKPTIQNALPSRRQFDRDSELAVKEVFEYYNAIDKDFGAGGFFYKRYTEHFSQYLNPVTPGFTEAVCSGTVSIYAAIQALSLPPNSEVLVSPITDPGMINPIIISSCKPKLIDYDPKKQDVSLQTILARVNKNTKLIILNHLAGRPIADIEQISKWSRENNIYLIEDASQCHGGKLSDKFVGTFGDISCFSTMFSKNHSSGGAGGLIYTQSKKIHEKILLEIDKGKPAYSADYAEKNPNTFIKPALNFKLNEISCAIGLATLIKLDNVNRKRRIFLKMLIQKMKVSGVTTELVHFTEDSAPFFAFFKFNKNKFNCSKIEFSESLRTEGVNINSDYKYVVGDWPWVKKYLADDYQAIAAKSFIESTFNLLFNENFTEHEADLIVMSLIKVEKHYHIN